MIRDMSRGTATHSHRLERWLGRNETERLSVQFRNFYWPVPVAGVPGRVYVMPGGDFAGAIEAGQEMSALDRADDLLRRHQLYQYPSRFKRQRGAFGDLAALLQAQRGGKSSVFQYSKNINSLTGFWIDAWYSGLLPVAGAVGGAAPGGTAPTNTTTGAMSFANPANANTSHLAMVAGSFNSVSVQASALLYDRLFSVAKTMSSTLTQAVTGVPTRYTSQTSTAGDYIGGSFCFPVVTTGLGATAHNWTVCQYTDQGGNTAQSFPSAAGTASTAANGLDLVSTGGQWFMPLASGDVGVKALTQMQCSASVTGAVDFVIGHPIVAIPSQIPNLLCQIDGINTAFNLVTVYDNACLALLVCGLTGSSVNYAGNITVVSE